MPEQSLAEALLTPKPRWRLVACDEMGARTELLDMPLTNPVMLVADAGGIVIGESRGFGSAAGDCIRMRAPDGLTLMLPRREFCPPCCPVFFRCGRTLIKLIIRHHCVNLIVLVTAQRQPRSPTLAMRA